MKRIITYSVIILSMLMALILVPLTASADVSWTTIGSSDCQYKIETVGTEVTLTIGPTNGTSGTLPDDYTEAVNWPWEGSYGRNAKGITKVVIQPGVKAGNSTTYMFYNCQSLVSIEGLSNLDTSNVTNMAYMFGYCYKLDNLDVSTFDTSKVQIMTGMFSACRVLKTFNLPNNFVKSAATDLKFMFSNCASIESLDVSKFDFSNVTTILNIFRDSKSLKTITFPNEPNTSKLVDAGYIFTSTKIDAETRKACINNLLAKNNGLCTNWTAGLFGGCTDSSITLSDLHDTVGITNIGSMFVDCTNITFLDLSGLDTSEVSNMNAIFSGCSSLKTIVVGDKWDIESVTSSISMFKDCTNLVGENGTEFDSANITATYAKIDGGTSAPGYLTSVDKYLEDKTICILNGKAYDAETGGNDITMAVASKGLKYVEEVPATEGTDAIPAHWEMNNILFTTTAGTGIVFLPGNDNTIIDVKGNNFIVAAKSTVDSCGIRFNSNALLKFTGDGKLVTVGGGSTGSNKNCYGIFAMSSMEFAGPTISAISGENTNGSSTGISAAVINVTAGSVTAQSSNAAEGKSNAVVSVYAAPVADAVIAGTTTKLTCNKVNSVYIYQNGGTNVANATLTPPAKITAGTQSGTITYAANGSASYDIALENLTEPDNFTVAWYDKDDKAINAPAGITTSYNKTTDKFTVTTDGSTPAGTYKFTLTSGLGTSDKITLTVGKCQLTIAGTQVYDKSYDGTTTATAEKGTVSGAVVGDDVTVTATAEFADKNAGANKATTVTYTISGSSADNYIAPVSETTLTASISQRVLTVIGTAADGKKYDGTTEAIIGILGTLSGNIEGDDVAIDTATGTFAQKDVGNGIEVTLTYTLKGADKDNYMVSGDSTAADIEKATITVTPKADQSKTYDGQTAADIEYEFEGQVEGETPAFDGALALTGAAIDAGAYNIEQGTLALTDNGTFKTSNYELAFTTDVQYTIARRDVTIEALDMTKIVGEEDEDLLALIDGLVSGEAPSLISYTIEREAGETCGTYNITVSGEATQGNYNVIFIGATYTIEEEPSNPETNDHNALYVLISIVTVSMLAGAIILLRKKALENKLSR